MLPNYKNEKQKRVEVDTDFWEKIIPPFWLQVSTDTDNMQEVL